MAEYQNDYDATSLVQKIKNSKAVNSTQMERVHRLEQIADSIKSEDSADARLLKAHIATALDALRKEIKLRDDIINARIGIIANYQWDRWYSEYLLKKAEQSMWDFLSEKRQYLGAMYKENAFVGDPCVKCLLKEADHVLAAKFARESKIDEGLLVHPIIIKKLCSPISHGARTDSVKAAVLHQTSASTLTSTLNSYQNPKGTLMGSHFVIDKDGKIYQTARIGEICWHVGAIRSRCYDGGGCTAGDTDSIKTIMKTVKPFKAMTVALHEHEKKKSYPERYPINEDSIGIECVGEAPNDVYVPRTDEQQSSVNLLLSMLSLHLGITASDLYRHPQVSYKTETEASSLKWNTPL